MTPEILHSLLRSLAQTDTAWTTASTSGAPHVQSVSNFIITLSDTTLHSSASPPVAGQLSALHTSATESLRWLRKCLTRLAAALRGAKQAHETILIASADMVVDPDALVLPLSRWAELMVPVIEGLEADLKDKREIVAVLRRTVETAHVIREELERGVATWLEQPNRKLGEAPVLLAAYEAESAQDVGASPLRYMGLGSPASAVERVAKVESPALAMLKESGRRKKR